MPASRARAPPPPPLLPPPNQYTTLRPLFAPMKYILLLCVFAQVSFGQVLAKPKTEFVTQILEPTGGSIQKPKSWFYTESHQGPSYTWILSKEDASKAPYITGVRIQTLIGVERGTKRSPKAFVSDFIDSKKKEARTVIKNCPEKDQGLFTRVCLETEEGPYRILYSCFWGNDIDVVVISIAGTTKELWPQYSEIFDSMSSFELIDMKRFEK